MKATSYFLIWGQILFMVKPVLCKDFDFIILHNNDMHSRFEKQRGYGGFARTSMLIKQFRKEADEEKTPPVLYLNAGDTFSGTVWFSIHRWRIAAMFMKALRPDVISLGNHELDDGVENMTLFAGHVDCPVVCANCDFSREPSLAAQSTIRPYHILTVKGRKIGVIGYLTPDTKLSANAGNIIFQDEVVAIRREAKYLTQKGIDIIIALGHSGFETDIRIAREVADVDIVVGGHTNTFLWHDLPDTVPSKEKPEGKYPHLVHKKGRKVEICPVVQAYAYTKYLGHLRVTFDSKGKLLKCNSSDSYVIFMNDSLPEDPEVIKLLKEFRPEVENAQRRIVGISKVDLNRENCKRSECNIANMILDAFVDYKASIYNGSFGWTDCPIAIMNGGATRSSIRKGPITMGSLFTTMPFFQKLISFDIRGDALKKTLEIGVKAEILRVEGEFIQVSGIHYVVDRHRPPNHRVSAVRVRCGKCRFPSYEPINLKKMYRIITIVFLANGGDGHTALQERENVYVEEVYDTEVVQRYLEFNTFVRPEIEERIYYPKALMKGNMSRQTRSFNNQIKSNISTYVLVLYILVLYNFL